MNIGTHTAICHQTIVYSWLAKKERLYSCAIVS
jgi:hypothetical protein